MRRHGGDRRAAPKRRMMLGRLFRFEVKKIFSLANCIVLACASLALLLLPILTRSSELGVYQVSRAERIAMFDAHEGLITEAYLRQALSVYRSLPTDIYTPEPGFWEFTPEEELDREWLNDLDSFLQKRGLPSFRHMGYVPMEGEGSILSDEQDGIYTYTHLDGFRLFTSILGGFGTVLALALPCYLLSPLLNMEVSSGMRRVILTVAGSEKGQIYSKWLAALLTAVLTSVLTLVFLYLGTLIATGFGRSDLSVSHLGISTFTELTISQYLLIRVVLLVLGSLAASALTVGASGIFTQSVGAMVSVAALFLLPMLPLPEEAPAWVVTAQRLGPAGFFTGDILIHFKPGIVALYILFWLIFACGIAVLGRYLFRTMKIPEEYFKA